MGEDAIGRSEMSMREGEGLSPAKGLARGHLGRWGEQRNPWDTEEGCKGRGETVSTSSGGRRRRLEDGDKNRGQEVHSGRQRSVKAGVRKKTGTEWEKSAGREQEVSPPAIWGLLSGQPTAPAACPSPCLSLKEMRIPSPQGWRGRGSPPTPPQPRGSLPQAP